MDDTLKQSKGMAIDSAYELARELMIQHGIGDWSLEFNYKLKSTFGRCNNHLRRISLNPYLVKLNSEDEVRDVILHEIAHALTPYDNHGYLWQQKAKEIGCHPERCYSKKTVNTIQPKWIATCPTCKFETEYHNRRKDTACGACCAGKYNKKHILKYRINPKYSKGGGRNE